MSGTWVRDGRLIYLLQHAGWKRGQEQFENRWSASVQPGRGCSQEEAEEVAKLMASAPDLKRQRDDLLAALRDLYVTATNIEEAIPMSRTARGALSRACGDHLTTESAHDDGKAGT